LFAGSSAGISLSTQFLGIYWMITGFLFVVIYIWNRAAWGWILFNGLLGIVAGFLIIPYPLWNTPPVPEVWVTLVGILAILVGVWQMVSAFRRGEWEVGGLGLLSILLGLLLIINSAIAALVLPWAPGFLLVVAGLLMIMAGAGLKFLDKRRSAESAEPLPAAVEAELSWYAADQEPEMVSDELEEQAEGDALRSAAIAAGLVGAAALAADGSEPAEPAPVEAAEDVDLIAVAAVAGLSAAIESDSDLPAEAAVSFAEEVPVAVLTGNIDPNDPEEMAKFKYPLEYVEGIGPIYAEKLKALGLASCLDLLKAGATRKGREDIVVASGISHKLILEWVNHLDLYRVKGVGSEYADLLEETGVDTVMELAQRNPEHLYERMNAVNAVMHLVRKLPTQAQVADWVVQAKTLPRMIAY
jgi:uncharacterized membrane protein HdeD (DUF308 family)/predicted flap endonuclease-1-like 5' DNA nuclease